MQILCAQIVEEWVHLFPKTQGDLQVVLHCAVPPERAGTGSIVFVSDPIMLGKALEAGSSAIVLPLKLEGRIPEGSAGAFLFTRNVKLAMALVLRHYFDDSRTRFLQDLPIDPRAFVSPEAVIGEGAIVAAGAFVGPGAVIGKGAVIGPNCVVEAEARVGAETSLGDHCLIGGRTTDTDHVKVCAGVQLGGLSAVTKDITEPGAYGGHPLQPFKAFLRTTTSIAHLPQMRKRLADLEQKMLGAE